MTGNITKTTVGKQDTQCKTGWLFLQKVLYQVVTTSEARKLNCRLHTVFREDRNF